MWTAWIKVWLNLQTDSPKPPLKIFRQMQFLWLCLQPQWQLTKMRKDDESTCVVESPASVNSAATRGHWAGLTIIRGHLREPPAVKIIRIAWPSLDEDHLILRLHHMMARPNLNRKNIFIIKIWNKVQNT